MTKDEHRRPINEPGPVPDFEAGSQLHRAIGERLLSNAPTDPTKMTNPPLIIGDIMRSLRVAHRVLDRFHASPKAHAAADKISNNVLKLVIDPRYMTTQGGTATKDAAPEVETHEATMVLPPNERTPGREQWSSLKFRSASKVQPHIHPDGRGDNDRVLDDAEHGIFGVFDGVGSSENATGAAEVVRDFAHKTLLNAAKPKSTDEAVRLMHSVFDGARAECKRLKIDGSTTVNLSFAVEIGGKDYLITGNAGDSVLYQATANTVSKVTTEQLFEDYPKYIFNSVGREPNHANSLTDKQLEQYVYDPSLIDPKSHLPRFVPDPKLLRDEVIIREIQPDMRFVHVSDGIAGDTVHERLAPSVFGDALRLDTPEAAIQYLFDQSIKEDDKSGVAFFIDDAFFAEAA